MKKAVKILLYAAFGIYCLALIKFLLLEGRFKTEDTVAFYFSRSNSIPFRSVFDYAQKIAHDQINISTVVRNIVGNLIVLFPLGCFLPCIWKRMQSFKITLAVCFGVVLAVEILQPLFRVGFLDIDDFIFNLAGASLGFWIVHIPFVNRLLKRFFVYETVDTSITEIR